MSKLLAVFSGEPRKFFAHHFEDAPTYWADSKEDVIKYWIKTNDPNLACLPLSDNADYTNCPSNYHLVMCSDDSCPCKTYKFCNSCCELSNRIPGKSIKFCKIGAYGGSGELEGGEDECQCEKPEYQSKEGACMEALDQQDGSDYLFSLAAINVARAIRTMEEPAKKKAKDTKSESD